MTNRYGDSVGIGNAERPKCWGHSYNSEDRECKGCPWQASCRDQVIRAAASQQHPPPQPVQSPMNYNFQPMPFQPPQYGAPAPYQAPAPAPVAFQPPRPLQAPQYNVVAYKPPTPVPLTVPTPVVPPQQFPQQYPQQQAQMVDVYGRFQDPLHYASSMAHPPYRPQMPGESFIERVLKNTALSLLESLTMQLHLALRQMVLPPSAPRSTVVDVTPERRA